MSNIPKRKQQRLSGYDYSQNGAYFITICTHKRRANLSQICRGGALLLPIGEIIEQELKKLQTRYNMCIDKYVIMPNHVHLIVFLAKKPREEQSPSPTITDIDCALKSIVTKEINAKENIKGRKVFQRSFYDHVIRNETDYLEIWQYIDENIAKWNQDELYIN